MKKWSLKHKIVSKSEDECIKYINRTFPKWLVGSTRGYSSDYPWLQHSWELICTRNNTTPQKIVLVDKIFFDKKDDVKHNLIMGICELFTRRGYVVRRKEEFICCSKCGKAIPEQDLWLLMKSKGMPVPKVWNTKCKDC